MLDVDTGFEGMTFLDPSEIGSNVQYLIGPVEWPAAVETESGRRGCALARRLCAVGHEADDGQNVQNIRVEEIGQLHGLAVRPLQGRKIVGGAEFIHV